MMIDFITVELPDPVGLPVNDGIVARVSQDGEVKWETHCRRLIEGSHSSSMTFRALGAQYTDQAHASSWELRAGKSIKESGLEISGNPAKFLQGHNLFGSCDLHQLLSQVVWKVQDVIWPDLFEQPQIDFSNGLISRIDLTRSIVLDREADVLPILRAMEQVCRCGHRGQGVLEKGGSTLYYGWADPGTRAKDWQFKLYAKGPEITKNKLPAPVYSDAELLSSVLNEVNRTIRVELTLRTAELKRLGLRKVGDWTPEKVLEIWELYWMKMEFGDSTINLDAVDLSTLGLKPRLIHAIGAWKGGMDMRAAAKNDRAFYRLRREILDATGFDIANKRPVSNVVPLRRVVTLHPALKPAWADHLTAALASAA